MNHNKYIYDINISSKYYPELLNKLNNLKTILISNLKKIKLENIKNTNDIEILFSFHLNKYEFIHPQETYEYNPTYQKDYDRLIKVKYHLNPNNPFISILIYKPITSLFPNYEIIHNFDILKEDSKILEITGMPSFFEACNYYYKSTNKKYDVILINENEKALELISQNIKINRINKKLDLNFFEKVKEKYDVICLSFLGYIEILRPTLYDYYNIPKFLASIIFSLINLNIGGNLILYFDKIVNKPNADLVLICKSVFKELHLYQPEIQNLVKLSGTYVICLNYQGCNQELIDKLIKEFTEYYNYDPTLTNKFNITEEEDRKLVYIKKPIDQNIEIKYFDGFLEGKQDYTFIEEFNKHILIQKLIFLEKLKQLYDMNEKERYEYLKKIRKQQLLDATLYAVKYGFEYYKYDDDFIDRYMETLINYHMYSLNDPIIFQFKKSSSKDTLKISSFFEEQKKKIYITHFLIDTRSITKYYNIKKETRYYSPIDRTKNLTTLVKQIIKKDVSQAWLKMQEIIVDLKLIDKNDGVFKTFHLCEAPGQFIRSIEYYIKKHTKLKYDWYAQSLRTSVSKDAFGDDYGIISNNSNRWIWGKDGTGNILNKENILFYKQYCNVELMTSDCGISKGDDEDSIDLIKVHFAQLLFILHCLPINGNFIAKLFLPIYKPLQISMIYLITQLFENVIFYKGVVNTFSLEFYIFGKKYKGIDKKMEDKLFDILDNFDANINLFPDYPIDFMYQLENILTKLIDNYNFNFKRQLFYVDHYEYIDEKHKKYIQEAIIEKNELWIKKMDI